MAFDRKPGLKLFGLFRVDVAGQNSNRASISLTEKSFESTFQSLMVQVSHLKIVEKHLMPQAKRNFLR
jgi:hypothetical protein